MQDLGPAEPDDWMAPGEPDSQRVTSDWMPVGDQAIAGVMVKEVRAVPTSNGCLTEIWRREWGLDPLPVDQVFQRIIDPGTVTGWHAHIVTTDRLFCAMGRVRIVLYDGRKSSPTYNSAWQRISGQERPLLVTIPPGVWHGVVGLGHVPSLLLNLVDQAYSYTHPDHRRLPPDTPLIPVSLV